MPLELHFRPLWLLGAMTFLVAGLLMVIAPSHVKAFAMDPCEQFTKDSKKWKKCKNKGKSSLVNMPTNNDEVYQAGYWLAKNGHFKRALKVLKTAQMPNDPRILNYTGFVNRKLGRVDEALVYYKKAVTIDPNYVMARSYMGEAFLQQGNIKKARNQLREIKNRCGKRCDAYDKLSKAIDDHLEKNRQQRTGKS